MCLAFISCRCAFVWMNLAAAGFSQGPVGQTPARPLLQTTNPIYQTLFATYSGCSVPHLVKVSSIHLHSAKGGQNCGSSRI